MTFSEVFPLCFYINLGRREDRRNETEKKLLELGISAERLPAVNATHIKDKPLQNKLSHAPKHESKKQKEQREYLAKCYRGYDSKGRYALAITQRMAIREAMRRKASCVMLFEDDVVFHPNFHSLFQSIQIPNDWGIFYLGCSHRSKPSWVAPRCVKCKYAVDTHAIAINAPYYRRVIKMLDRHLKTDFPDIPKASDQYLALLQGEVPTYSCYPNLVWQADDKSDLMSFAYSNYHHDGTQKHMQPIHQLLHEMIDYTVPKQIKIALLFLTRNDVNHPKIWHEFVSEAPNNISIYNHPKHKIHNKHAFLYGKEITEKYDTAWGNISLVKATIALLREAMKDESNTHFMLLSEACVPVKPLPEILRHLEIDFRTQFGFRHWTQAHPHHKQRMISVPEVPQECWHFQSQWMMLDRITATFCMAQDYTPYFASMFAADEAYFATVLTLQGFPMQMNIHNRDITWTYWDGSSGSPVSFHELPYDKLHSIVRSEALFARKFPVGADIGKYGLHRSRRYV